MVDEQKKSWKQRFGIGAIVGGLLLGGATHKEEIQALARGEENKSTIQIKSEKNLSSEMRLILDYHNTFTNNSFFVDAAKVGIKGFQGDFNFILDTIQLEKITDNDIKQLVATLELIVKQSKEVNSKYKYLKSVNSTEILDLDEKLEFYRQFEERKEFVNYISAIQSIIKKNSNYSKLNDSSLMYITNLHAFAKIKKH